MFISWQGDKQVWCVHTTEHCVPGARHDKSALRQTGQTQQASVVRPHLHAVSWVGKSKDRKKSVLASGFGGGYDREWVLGFLSEVMEVSWNLAVVIKIQLYEYTKKH